MAVLALDSAELSTPMLVIIAALVMINLAYLSFCGLRASRLGLLKLFNFVKGKRAKNSEKTPNINKIDIEPSPRHDIWIDDMESQAYSIKNKLDDPLGVFSSFAGNRVMKKGEVEISQLRHNYKNHCNSSLERYATLDCVNKDGLIVTTPARPESVSVAPRNDSGLVSQI